MSPVFSASARTHALARVIVLFLCGTAVPSLAQTEGQADLDSATQLKLSSQSMADLERVVELCESALQKGLDDESAKLARSLLTATLYQHASRYAQAILSRDEPPGILRRFALRDLNKALEHDENLPEVHLLIARLAALPPADIEKGSVSARRAVELLSQQEDKTLLAKALVVRASYQRDSKQRIDDLDKAIELDPKYLDAWRARGALYAAQSQLLVRQNKLDEAKKARESAISDFMQLIEQDPSDTRSHQFVAGLLANAGDVAAALAHLETAIELNPGSPTPYVMRAGIHRAQKKYDEAIADFNRAIDLKPDNYKIFLERSRTYLEKGDGDAARADVDLALEIEPGNPEIVFQRSVIAEYQKQYDDAIRDTEQLIEQLRDKRPLRLRLGSLHVMAKQPSKAVAVFGLILEESPKYQAALRGRADAYLSLGRQAEAIADYNLAYDINPKDDGVLNNLAWVLSTSPQDELRNASRAIELATAACEVTGYQQAHILSTLAAAYAEAGDFEKAIEWSTKAVELDKGRTEQLMKELESYKRNEPWRELQQLEEESTVAPPEDDDIKPDDDEVEAADTEKAEVEVTEEK